MAISLVAILGACGVLLRYGLVEWLPQGLPSMPVLIVNIAGSFLAGFVYQSRLTFLTPIISAEWLNPLTIALMVGFLGGLTTFSSFALDTARLIQESQWVTAILNFVLNNTLSVAAAFFGLKSAGYMTSL